MSGSDHTPALWWEELADEMLRGLRHDDEWGLIDQEDEQSMVDMQDLKSATQEELRRLANDTAAPQSPIQGKEVYVVHTVSRTLKQATVLRSDVEPMVNSSSGLRHCIFFSIHGDVTTNFHGWRVFNAKSYEEGE